MQWFFAYLDDDEDYAEADLDRTDECVMDLKVSHAEGGFATVKVLIKTSSSSYASLGRRACVSAQFVDGGSIVPLIVGTVTAIPRALRGQTVELELIAQRDDWEELRDTLIDSLAVAPFFDPLFVSADQVRDPAEVLNGRAAMLHWDRLTGEPSISYIDRTSRPIREVDSGMLYGSVGIELEGTPIRRTTVEVTAAWQQDASVVSEVDWEHGATKNLKVVAHEACQNAWPKPQIEIGGGWSVEQSALKFGQPKFEGLGEVKSGSNEIWSGDVPVYTAMSDKVVLRNKRAQARTETVRVICTTRFAPGIKSTTTDKEAITLRRVYGTGDEFEPWQPTVSYDVGDVVFYSGKLYECSTAHTASYAFNAARWTVLESSAGKIGASFFETTRGQAAIRHAAKRGFSRLRYAARCVRVSFQVPLVDWHDISLDDVLHVYDARLPGGSACGKVVEYELSSSSGLVSIEIACSVGIAGLNDIDEPSITGSFELDGAAAPKLGPTTYPATGRVSPLAAAQLAELREDPRAYNLSVRVEMDAPAVPSTYELARALTVAIADPIDVPSRNWL